MGKKIRVILVLLVIVLMINIIPATSIAVNTIQVELGDTITLSVPGNKTAKWISSNSSIATVTQKGKVTGKKTGYVLIMAETSKTIYYWTVHVVVSGPPKIIGISDSSHPKGISHKAKTILTGENNSFRLYLYNIEGSPTWKSSNKNIVTVSSNGGVDCEITGKKEGKATVTATLNGKKYSCKVTVYKKTLYAKPTTVTIDAGKKKKITVRVKSKDAMSYDTDTFGMINEEWGEWDGDTVPLTIEGLKEGKTTLTIRNDNTGEKVNIKVKVNKGERNNIFDIKYNEEEEDGYHISPNAGKEYRDFHEKWLSKERLKYFYKIHFVNNFYTQQLILIGGNKNGDGEEYIINNTPEGVLEEGVIYEGIYNDIFTIRFQYVNKLNLDGKNYEIDSICLNIEDLRKAGIID